MDGLVELGDEMIRLFAAVIFLFFSAFANASSNGHVDVRYNINALRHPRKITTMPEMALYIKPSVKGPGFTLYEVGGLALEVGRVMRVYRPVIVRWHPQRETLLVNLPEGQTLSFNPHVEIAKPAQVILDKLRSCAPNMAHLLESLNRLYGD